jgi:hypothetical protein
MKRISDRSEALWPILSADERLPVPPALWVLLNVAVALLIAVPFCSVIGATAFGFWGANWMRDAVAARLVSDAMALAIGTNFVKILLAVLAVRMECLLLDLVPWAVSEARAIFAEVVSESV